MPVEQITNNAASTLNGSITNSATSLTVQTGDGAKFPTANFSIIIGTELIFVGSRSSDTFSSLVRGSEGTAAASHNNGDAVTHILTARSIKALGTILHEETSFGTRPSASLEGRLHFPNNGLWIARDNGSSWKGYGPVFPITEPADPGTWINQLSATLTLTSGGLFLLVPATGTEGIHARVKSTPSTPWTLTLGFIPMQTFVDFSSVGICLRESGTSKIIIQSLTANTFYQSGGGTQTRKGITVGKWSNAVTGVADYTTTPAGIFGPDWHEGSCYWFQVTDDGTDLKFRVSNDGINFFQILSSARNNFFTTAPDQYGFFVRNFTTLYDIGMMVVSLKES